MWLRIILQIAIDLGKVLLSKLTGSQRRRDANEAEKRVDILSDDGVSKRLRDEYSRD